MQKDPNDRSLDGREREHERIMLKRLEVQKKKAELEIDQFRTQIDGVNVEIEAKEKVIEDLVDRIEKGKRLVGGAKIKDVFPPPKPEPEEGEKKALEDVKKQPLVDFKKKPDGGEKREGKV